MPQKNKTLPPFKEFAIGVTMRAGNILHRNFSDRLMRTRTKKNRYEVVTKSDIEVHRYMRFKIKEQFPEHNFLSEEGDPIDNGSEYTWIVDPLDGTLNYSILNPFFCTSLVLLKEDVPVISVIYAPVMGEMFVAEKGKSTRLNERNVRVSEERNLKKSVLSYAFFERDPKSKAHSLKLWQRLDDASLGMRHLGSTSLELAYVACGRLEAQVITPPQRSWDVYPGMLMVETAGGRITNLKGKKWTGMDDGMISSNGGVHNQVLNIIKKHR